MPECYCGKTTNSNLVRCDGCRKVHAKSNKKLQSKYFADGLCRCGRERVPKLKICANCQKTRSEYTQRLRLDAIEAYGGKCQCPGECDVSVFEFLGIDHINNDGKQHREQIGSKIYLWLKRNGYPKDRFRLLCHNCNMARNFYGVCPHIRKPTLEDRLNNHPHSS